VWAAALGVLDASLMVLQSLRDRSDSLGRGSDAMLHDAGCQMFDERSGHQMAKRGRKVKKIIV
jgi:hypothetical protein